MRAPRRENLPSPSLGMTGGGSPFKVGAFAFVTSHDIRATNQSLLTITVCYSVPSRRVLPGSQALTCRHGS